MKPEHLVKAQTGNGTRTDWGASWKKSHEGKPEPGISTSGIDRRDNRDPERIGRVLLAYSQNEAAGVPLSEIYDSLLWV